MIIILGSLGFPLANYSMHILNYPFVIFSLIYFGLFSMSIKPLILELAAEITFPYGKGRISGVVELMDNLAAMGLVLLLEPLTKAHGKPDPISPPKNLCYNENANFRRYDYIFAFNIMTIVTVVACIISGLLYKHKNNRKIILQAVHDHRTSIQSQVSTQSPSQ